MRDRLGPYLPDQDVQSFFVSSLNTIFIKNRILQQASYLIPNSQESEDMFYVNRKLTKDMPDAQKKYPLGNLPGLVPDQGIHTPKQYILLDGKWEEISRIYLGISGSKKDKKKHKPLVEEFLKRAPDGFPKDNEEELDYCLSYASVVATRECLAKLAELAYALAEQEPDCDWGKIGQFIYDSKLQHIRLFHISEQANEVRSNNPVRKLLGEIGFRVNRGLSRERMMELRDITNRTFEYWYVREGDDVLGG
jgi:hypothetical protein